MGKVYPTDDIDKFDAIDQGIVVCLGWVPHDKFKYGLKTGDIKTVKPFEEKENVFGECYDHNRGHLYLSYDDDDPREGSNTDELRVVNELQEIEGFLRVSEKRDVLLGKVNNDQTGVFNRVDLKRMAGFFHYANLDSEMFYIERAVENLEESEDLDLLPIPTSFKDTLKHVEDYEKNSIYDKYNKMMYVSPVLAAIGFLI